MKFDTIKFCQDFSVSIDASRNLRVNGKTSNGVDTTRVFLAADDACDGQPNYFQGRSFWCGKDGGEFLCDYTFHNNSNDITLSLESEWGKYASPSATIKEVCFDFRKIINMISPIKVMVFAYKNLNNEADILASLSTIMLERRISISEEVLAVSCPWEDEMYSETIKFYKWIGEAWQTI